GDEAFGGYASSIAPLNAQIFNRRFPAFLHPAFIRLFEKTGVNPESQTLQGRMLYYMKYIRGFPYRSFYNKMGFHLYRQNLWDPRFRAKIGEHDPLHPFHEIFDRVKNESALDQVFYADLKTRLPFDYLVKVDRASSANSVEVRSPFLDHELIEFMAHVPPEIKFRGRQTKYLLKKIGEKYLPKSLLYAEKRGFEIPIRRWLIGEYAPTVEAILFSRRCQSRGYFNFDFIRQIWNEHQQGIYDHRHRLWALLWFELWNLMFVDKTLARDMPLTEAAKLT
ncbi:MAG: asparagine synthase C-terminal domain-containing protein, partial [archaeon]